MKIDAAFVDIDVDGSPMRTYVARPRGPGPFPGLVAFSDIFQLTPSTLRAIDRLCGYGCVVAAPEIYHRVEVPGSAFAFDDAGRTRGMADAKRTSVAQFDADGRAVLTMLAKDPGIAPDALGAVGWCLGGHLALRAALSPPVRATACVYPTGVHSGDLGSDADAATLARVAEIRGALLLIFGSADPHVPAEGRERIARTLDAARVPYTLSLYDAEHAFMRDEGPRYDPELTDRAYLQAATFFREAFGTKIS